MDSECAFFYNLRKIDGSWKSNVFFEKSLKDGCNFLYEPRSSSVGRALDCTNSRGFDSWSQINTHAGPETNVKNFIQKLNRLESY